MEWSDFVQKYSCLNYVGHMALVAQRGEAKRIRNLAKTGESPAKFYEDGQVVEWHTRRT